MDNLAGRPTSRICLKGKNFVRVGKITKSLAKCFDKGAAEGGGEAQLIFNFSRFFSRPQFNICIMLAFQ